MEEYLTLNTIKQEFSLQLRKKYTQVSFLKAIFPQILYQNPNPDLDIHLCDSYDLIKSWLSCLMNYRSDTRTGANRVRKLLMDIILCNPNVIDEIALNCEQLCSELPHASTTLPCAIQALVNNTTSVPSIFKERLIPQFSADPFYAVAQCIVFALFPDNQEQILNILYPLSRETMTKPLPQETSLSDCLAYLYDNLTELIRLARTQNDLLNSPNFVSILASCKRVMQYRILLSKLPDTVNTSLQKLVQSFDTLCYWDDLHPAKSKQEIMNRWGKRLNYIAQTDLQLQSISTSLAKYS